MSRPDGCQHSGGVAFALGVLLGEPSRHAPGSFARARVLPLRPRSGLAGEMLLTEGRPHRTEILTIELPVAGDYRSGHHQVGTEEFVLCIGGTLEIGPIDQEQFLRPGDSLWFPADSDHRYASRRGARGLSVISYPTLREA